MQLLDAAQVPNAWVAAVGLSVALELNQAEQFLREGARSGKRVVPCLDNVYVIESGYQDHRNSRVNATGKRATRIVWPLGRRNDRNCATLRIPPASPRPSGRRSSAIL
jgi:hypothetical protein